MFIARSHLAAQRGLRQRQCISGLREASMARGRLEGFQLVERRQALLAVVHGRSPFQIRGQYIQEYRLKDAASRFRLRSNH